MNLHQLPTELLELVFANFKITPRLDTDSPDAKTFKELRLVCHIFDDVCTQQLARNTPIDFRWRRRLERAWSLDAIICFLRSKALILHRSRNYLEDNKDATVLSVVCRAADALYHFLSEHGKAIPSMKELIHRACTAIVFNISFYDLYPMLVRDSPDAQHLRMEIKNYDLLPLLAMEGDTRSMSVLLRNANINQRSEIFGSALYMAAAMDRPEAVTWLLKHGADPNLVGGRWHCALRASIEYSTSTDSLSVLINAGANVNLQGGDKMLNPIMTAVDTRNKAAVEILLDQPCLDVEIRDAERDSVVHHLCRAVDAPNMRKLLQNHPKINLNQCGSHGTPAHAIINCCIPDFTSAHDEIVEMLLEHGADIDMIETGTAQSPLQWAGWVKEAAMKQHKVVPAAVQRILDKDLERKQLNTAKQHVITHMRRIRRGRR